MSRKSNRLKNRLRMANEAASSAILHQHDKIVERDQKILALNNENHRLKDDIRSSHITLALQPDFASGGAISLLRMTAMTYYTNSDNLQPTMVEHVIDRRAMEYSGGDVAGLVAEELTRKLTVFMQRNGLVFRSDRRVKKGQQ